MSKNLRRFNSSRRQNTRDQQAPPSSSYQDQFHRSRNFVENTEYRTEAPMTSGGYSYLSPNWMDSVREKTSLSFNQQPKNNNRSYREIQPSASYDAYQYSRVQDSFPNAHPRDHEEAYLVQQIANLQQEIDNIEAYCHPDHETSSYPSRDFSAGYSPTRYSRRSPIPKRSSRGDRRYDSEPRGSKRSNRLPRDGGDLPRLMDIPLRRPTRREPSIQRNSRDRSPPARRDFRSSRERNYRLDREPIRKPINRPRQSNPPVKRRRVSPSRKVAPKTYTKVPKLEQITDDEATKDEEGLKIAHAAIKRWMNDEYLPAKVIDSLKEKNSLGTEQLEEKEGSALKSETDQTHDAISQKSQAEPMELDPRFLEKKQIIDEWCQVSN